LRAKPSQFVKGSVKYAYVAKWPGFEFDFLGARRGGDIGRNLLAKPENCTQPIP
jgi:hypothetical protein